MEKENEMEKRKWEEMKRVEREDKPSNTPDGREVRELEPRLMKEGEWRERLKMKESEMKKGKKRENEGCSVHWKSQIQLKQDCWIEDSKMMERSEGRNEWRSEWEEGGKRDWRFVRLEKTSFLKTRSSLDWKLLKMENDGNEWKTSKMKKTNHKQRS